MTRVSWCSPLVARSLSCAVVVGTVLIGAVGVGGASSGGALAAETPCSPIRLSLANPQAGDLLLPGDYMVNGTVSDATAPTAPGIDRVQAFWDGSRESGGRFVGEVTSGGGNTPNERLDAAGFTVLVTIPDIAAVDNTHVLYVYARSTQTGAEQVASVTVQVNKPLSVGAFTPTPTPPPVVFAMPVCGTPTPTPTFPEFPRTELTSTPVPAAAPTNGGLTLQVSNPQPGDTIAHGMYVIQGVAFDSRATGSAGVRQVQVFLDPRDGGGQLLGEAQLAQDAAGGPFGFILIAPLPNRTGNHTLAIYARSDVVDQEVTVEVPITLE